MAQQGEPRLEDLWAAMQVAEPKAMISIAASILNKYNTEQQSASRTVIPEPVVRDALEIIGVYVDFFELWSRVHQGMDIREIDRLLLGPSIKLDVCNDTWKQSLQHVVRPIVTNCVGAVQQSRILYGSFVASEDPETRERLIETIWSLQARRYDFVPWVVFMLTSDSELWAQCQISIIKIAQDGDLPTFKRRFMN